ncbi:Response regulator/sensory box/HDIG domain protein [Desulfovibrio sp. DV]|uniref:HD domain-containing phosphohydrolase n=1 Tax=Desulfovibrio sp. DV TaxID=1844708 RepID=UPI00094BA3F4|nr:HD domain-containing phosphohydrolase [Desulfovibrio sp. DV]OLN29213.1 Response regulator/sensory box/HDIG domain protein [Desulfovibrio sp. DV]
MPDTDSDTTSAARILVVEDEAVVAIDVRHRLTRLGYTVAGIADSGEEAVRLVGELAPDMILMDIILAGKMDGVDAATLIRERYAAPVVFLTAHSDRATLRRAGAAGPYGYLIKPFEERELQSALEIALYKSRMERKLAKTERLTAITLKCLGEGLLTTDETGQVVFVNPAAETLLGVAAAAIVGQPLEAVYRATPGEADGPTGREQAVLHCPGGRDVPVEQTTSPILDAQGGSIGTVVVFRDVSQRLMAEQALRDSVANLRCALAETVNALTVTSEKRDPFTAGHQQRVSHLAAALAVRLGLPEEACEGVRVAGLVHDIGKIHVPAEILAKPEALNAMEMGIVHDHSAVGYEILKSIPFPWPVARMVLEHHERMDGSGYPGHLGADAVLLASRILAVADVIEAMNSHRPYRAAPGREASLAEIRSGRGRLYDPDVVDCCLELFLREGYQL